MWTTPITTGRSGGPCTPLLGSACIWLGGDECFSGEDFDIDRCPGSIIGGGTGLAWGKLGCSWGRATSINEVDLE